MESKAECDQLNPAHIAINKKNINKKKLKQTIASAHLVQCRFKIREGSAEGSTALCIVGHFILGI